MVTVPASAAAAAFLSPAKMHVMVELAVTDAAVVTVSTRLVLDMEAAPTVRPVQVRADVGEVAVSKLTPATVTALISPGFADTVNVTVAETPVAALTVLERVTDGAVSAPAVIAARVRLADESFAELAPAMAVDIVTVV